VATSSTLLSKVALSVPALPNVSSMIFVKSSLSGSSLSNVVACFSASFHDANASSVTRFSSPIVVKCSGMLSSPEEALFPSPFGFPGSVLASAQESITPPVTVSSPSTTFVPISPLSASCTAWVSLLSSTMPSKTLISASAAKESRHWPSCFL